MHDPHTLAPEPQQAEPEAERRDDARDGFDWADDSLLVPGYQAVAVYPNQHNDIVIRRERHPYLEEDDVCIVIQRERVPALIAKLGELLQLTAEPETISGYLEPPSASAADTTIEPAPAPPRIAAPVRKDRTAAERQRRWRERQRNSAAITTNIKKESA